jgi:polyisoprenoid-binding protein YceI
MLKNFARIAAVAIAVIVALPAAAAPQSWMIEPNHSKANFKVKHLGISNVRGTVAIGSGSVVIDDENPAKSSVEATLPLSTIDTGNEKRDEHLKGADFFDATKNPSITFKSTAVEKSKDGYKVTGNLTMHGVTKSVVLDMEAPSAAVKSPYGNMVRGVSATTTINRKDFGLTWNKALEAGGLVVGEDVKIDLDIELTPPPPAAPAAPAKK